jgi:hypothetical protein
MDIQAGAVIEAIDGRDLTPAVDPGASSTGRRATNVLLRVRDPGPSERA